MSASATNLTLPNTTAQEPIPSPHVASPSSTVVDITQTATATEKRKPTSGDVENSEENEIKKVHSKSTKFSLLAVFSAGIAIDVWSFSAFFVLTDPISVDLGIPRGQQSWVITSYAVALAAFLLFWGRVSDLYSAKPVFVYGMLVLGLLNLVISFLPEKYSWFVIRALSGVAGSMVIPSSYRLIVQVFEPEELNMAFTIYGMTGAVANITGILIGGFLEYIPNGGQATPWRWFFRIVAIVLLPAGVYAWYAVPKQLGQDANVESKWRRLDIVGSFFSLASVVLLILGLTLGASEDNGWKHAKFLAPFLLAWPLFVAFFIWEWKIPTESALLPPKTWWIPNFTALIVLGLYVYQWWSSHFVVMIEVFTLVRGDNYMIAAVRMLPEGIIATAAALYLSFKPLNPRISIPVGMVLSLVGMVLFTQGHTLVGTDYWRYLFPGMILGSGGMMMVFSGVNVGVMTAVPPDVAGVAGGVVQMAFQIGSVIGLSIQAGLLTVNDGWVYNFKNVQASWYFEIGWGIIWVIGFVAFYRPSKNLNKEGGAGAV